MFPMQFRTAPHGTDRYGRPWYPLDQTRGLAEHQSFDLVGAAQSSGYLGQVGEAIVDRVASLVRTLAGERRLDIIELGGGDGILFDRVRHAARSYINIEPGDIELTPEALRRLADPLYGSVRCSAEDVPLADASADIVLAVASIDHVPDPARALAEAARCLRPGGYMIVTLNNRRSWWKILLGRTAYLARRERAIAAEHSVLWSLRDCREQVGRRFSIVDASSMIHWPYVPVVWRAMLPLTSLVGPRLAPALGGHSVVIGRAW